MPCVRPVLFTAFALLAGCGGKVVTGEDNGNGHGSAGASSGTTTGTMTTPGLVLPDPTGSGGSVSTGGGYITTPCGSVTCGPGLVCCNASCGVCTLPNEACDDIACRVPVFDAGPGPAVDSGPCLSGGGGGGGGIVELQSDYGFQWKDSWFIRGCQLKVGHDCVNIAGCPNLGAPNFEDRGAVTTELFPVGGSPCTTYSVTFQVNGISEAKYYQGGTRDAGGTIPANVDDANLDTFYQGGTPVVSNYDVLRMRVLDSSKKEVTRYYMNSGPQNSGMESHRTFALSYQKTIDVPGGGFIEYLTEDSNCHSIDNCGPGNVSDTACDAPRGIPHEEANPLPAMGIDPNPANDVNGKHRAVALATLNSVNGATKPWHSQIVHVTITKGVAK